MTTKNAAAPAWTALNERQQTWLLEIYRADQDAEEANRTAWHDGRRRQPASVWRWLEYGAVDTTLTDGPSGMLQERLNARKVWDQGAGSTMAVLVDRGLIETKREPQALSTLLSIKITPLGRAAARAGGADDTAPARRRPEGLLGETLWGMLVDVYRAGDKGLQRRLTSGGWEALAERGLVTIGKGYPSILTVALAGREHYRAHWAEYARLYPGVDAPNPDPAAAWPADVDDQLKELATTVLDIGADLHAIARRRKEKLTDPPAATPKGATPERVARDRLHRDRHKQDTRLQQLLGEHHQQLTTLYRDAVGRYVAVAAAVVTAAVAGDDPHSALATEPAPLDDFGHAPTVPCPRTGLDGVDRELQLAHRAAVSGPKRHRRRQDRQWEEGTEPCGPNVGAVRRYAEHLRQLVDDGYLTRLLLRRP